MTSFVEINEDARHDLREAIGHARELRRITERPPVTDNECLCKNCSLNVVCLPEEERLDRSEGRAAPTLFPSNRERHTLHVVARKAYVSRSGETLVVKTEEGKQTVPIEQVDSVLIHGYAQMTTQAIHLCAHRGVSVGWMTFGGRFLAGRPPLPDEFNSESANTGRSPISRSA